MTYLEIYEKALWDLEHNNITLGEFEERIIPLNQEVRKTGHWIDNKVQTKLCNCSECDALSKVYTKYCPNCGAKMLPRTESEEVQSKQTNDSCLNFDFDKVKEILKKDGLDNLIIDHTCKENKSKSEMKGEADGK